MVDDASRNEKTKESSVRVQTALAAFRHVGVPLLQSAFGVAGDLAEGSPLFGAEDGGASPQKISALVDSVVALSRALTKEFAKEEDKLDASVRWGVVGASSQVVAAHYQATGNVPSDEALAQLVRIAVALQEKFKTQMPAGGEAPPNTAATFRAKMMEGLVPVVGAVAQYAYGRAEHDLLAEVAERLVKTADQVTRALADSGATPEQWRLLCWSVLRAAGQIYAESHYAEADRLNAMDPDQQAAYFSEHKDAIPMTQVWQAFHQRMAMLATLATYLDVPQTARLEEQGW